MKYKITLTALTAVLLLLIFTLTCYASEIEYSEIYESANRATQNLLGQAGIENVDYEQLLNLSPKTIIDIFVSLFRGSLEIPFKTSGIIIAIIIVFSVTDSFSGSSLQSEEYYSFFENALILTTVAAPLSKLIGAAASVVKTVCDFMLAFIPVYTGAISASGQPVSSFLYSSALLAFAEFCSVTLSGIIVPVFSVITCINIFAVLAANNSVQALLGCVKKVIITALSVTGALFVGFVNLRTELAYSADSLCIKGIKMLSGSVIPIIGSSVGEAVNSIIGALSLVKSTLGVFSITAIAFIYAPTLTELLLWNVSLNICGAVSDSLKLETAAKGLKTVAGLISLLSVFITLIMMIFILTTGNMISLRG